MRPHAGEYAGEGGISGDVRLWSENPGEMGDSWLWLLLYRESRTLGCDWDEPKREPEPSGWFWCDWDEPYRESRVRGWDWYEERRE